MIQEKSVEVLVVGAGPAGFSVAAECGYHELGPVLILEKGATHNQTIHQYYPEAKRVDAAYLGQEAICAGVLCFRDTTKTNFLEIVEQMAANFHLPIQYDLMVDSIKKQGDQFSVSTTDGKLFSAKHVVIAVGRMGKPNRPEYFNQIPPAARKRVQFDVRNLDPEGKEILVVGGGNSAVEFALSLADRGRVTISYRQATFARLNPMNLNILEEDEKLGKLTVLRESNVEKIEEKDGLPLVYFKELPPRTFDYVVFGIGGSSPAAFLQNAGIELDAKGNPKLSEWLETNVPGLYVAGELSVPPGKGSIIVSFNSGKKIVEGMMKRLGRVRKPEIVAL